eukprot:TRINITY_DN39502_c0_g1_i2.p1 TRINITY_DN39502_c0_g1~~TRINITY_DN39502_c0_g1_i2.p1  ORF type:complete len:501 (-),score=51.56 TRINITY_DN39502_c0_g1_i2:15-1517(-)
MCNADSASTHHIAELLEPEIWQHRVRTVSANVDAASTAPKRSLANSTHPTEALILLLDKPWGCELARLLLQEEADVLDVLQKLYSLQRPSGGFKKGHWALPEVRRVFEPALLVAVKDLLEAQADANASSDDDASALVLASSEGLCTVVQALLKAKASVDTGRPHFGSALRVAVLQQNWHLADVLMQAGSCSDRPDACGYTPAAIRNLAESSCDSNIDPMHSHAEPAAKRSRIEIAALPTLAPGISCQAFFHEHIALKRPAVLRQATAELIRGEQWTAESLSARAGESQVEVGSIPYGDDFGCPDAAWPTTLSDFLSVGMDLFAPSGGSYYLFTAVDDRLQPQLARLIRDNLNGMPETLPAPFSSCRATTLQFAIGGQGSGAPSHFHGDAFNMLLKGRKRWWVWPPYQAAMSRIHPRHLCRQTGAAPELGVAAAQFVCIQHAGDVVYVPDGWGHAVLNEADQTMCIAVEFDSSPPPAALAVQDRLCSRCGVKASPAMPHHR